MNTTSTAMEQRQPKTAEQTSKGVRIGDLLMARGLITQEQIDQALAYQRGSDHHKLLGQILVELKFVTEAQVMEERARADGIPFVTLTPQLVDAEVLGVLPREFLTEHQVLPLFLVNGRLTVAVSEPTNVFLMEEIERKTGYPVHVVVATNVNIRAMQSHFFRDSHLVVVDELVGDMQEGDLAVVDHAAPDVSEMESDADQSPVIKLVNHLIFSAVQEGASDVHIEPDEGVLRVRYRIDGCLFEKMKPPYQMTPAVVSRIKIMGGMDISERRAPQDGGFTVMVSKQPVDVRVSTVCGKFGEKVVLRIMDKRAGVTMLDKLGMSATMVERFRAAFRQPNGILLVTGPTGSGKSTTLYAVLAELNAPDVNVSTVEDPIELNLAGVNQFQTNDKAGFTFASALRALLRQDPDIVMVGEIRDTETARIAIQAALTGHLVLSTLHTNDAPSAVTRLINVGVEPYLVAATIRAVLAQRLVRRICADCREPVTLEASAVEVVSRLCPAAAPMATAYQGTGCSRCHNMGSRGRVGIFEMYVPDDDALDAISRGVSLQELRRLAASSERFTGLWLDGLEKVRAGLTTVEQLFGVVSTD